MSFQAEKIEVRQLTPEDLFAFRSLIKMFNVVFEEADPGIGRETSLRRLLRNNCFIAIAALSENEVVGGLTAYVLPMYDSDSSEVFLYDMAVSPELQRMGIGKRLIHQLNEYCIAHGVKEFFVMAHEEDEHAVDFYRSTGGRSEKVVNFIYEAKVFRE